LTTAGPAAEGAEMTTDDVHDCERRAAGLQQRIDKVPHEETAGLLIDDVDEVAVLRDGPVGTPEQIVARIVGVAGGPAEQAAWVALQEELSNLRAASRAVRELINTLAAPAVAETSVPADALRHALQVGLRLGDVAT
jgi:predicted RNA-binding Zn ribbon-like protein